MTFKHSIRSLALGSVFALTALGWAQSPAGQWSIQAKADGTTANNNGSYTWPGIWLAANSGGGGTGCGGPGSFASASGNVSFRFTYTGENPPPAEVWVKVYSTASWSGSLGTTGSGSNGLGSPWIYTGTVASAQGSVARKLTLSGNVAETSISGNVTANTSTGANVSWGTSAVIDDRGARLFRLDGGAEQEIGPNSYVTDTLHTFWGVASGKVYRLPNHVQLAATWWGSCWSTITVPTWAGFSSWTGK